jgi:formate dehydrogenase assembly factor FdhD
MRWWPVGPTVGREGARGLDAVAVAEPLEIRIGGEPVAVTMRTPGHDEELANVNTPADLEALR